MEGQEGADVKPTDSNQRCIWSSSYWQIINDAGWGNWTTGKANVCFISQMMTIHH